MFVSQPTVSRWETDSVTPNAQALQRLSEVLGVRFVIGDAGSGTAV
jgi:transcriptional regulator with XRE-family HTH domain